MAKKWDMDTGGLFRPEVLNETDLRTFDEVSIFIAKHICDEPICIETGTMYSWEPETPCWNTTTSILKRICLPKKGILYSIDLVHNLDVLEKAFEAAEIPSIIRPFSYGSNEFRPMPGDSIQRLREISLSKLDLLCLDSGEDPDLMLGEYDTIKHFLSDKHYVLVDDIHNKNSVKYLKMVPILKELGYDWVQIPTETGLFVAVKGYPVPRK